MHKLDRTSVSTPACLAAATAAGRAFERLDGSEKAELRTALLAMQGDRCAYCERRTGTSQDDGHVEHFIQQARIPALALTWANLYYSCDVQKTCGKKKDQYFKDHGVAGYPAAGVLIDPGIDDPEEFILFLTDGTVHLRDGLTQADMERACWTIKLFGLDNPGLTKDREDAVESVYRFCRILQDKPEDLMAYAQEVRQGLDRTPFATAIKHFLEGVI